LRIAPSGNSVRLRLCCVALVLIFVEAFAHHKATGISVLPNLGVVAGGDKVAAQLVGTAQQSIPFDVGVAKHAGVRGAASEVFGGEVVDDEIPEFFPNINDVVRKTQAHGNVAGIVDAIERAAAGFLFGAAGRGVVPGFHRHADDFVAGFVQQHRGYRRVDAATHGHEYAALGWGNIH
jgi:hypothetical protein